MKNKDYGFVLTKEVSGCIFLLRLDKSEGENLMRRNLIFKNKGEAIKWIRWNTRAEMESVVRRT